MNKKETFELLADSFRMMAADLEKVVGKIDRTAEAWGSLSADASKEQIQQVARTEEAIMKEWEKYHRAVEKQRNNVIFLVSGLTNKN